MKWEYYYITYPLMPSHELFNTLGDKGWELVQYSKEIVIFKRPKKDD